jgi:PAS domain S-box-containing protein
MQRKLTKVALRTSLLYAFFAALWILLSDRVLVTLISDPEVMGRLSMYKGWLFVLVTASLLYFTLRKPLQRWEEEAVERRRAEESLHLYKVLSEHTRDIILSMRSEDGRILEANAAAVKAYGYSYDEMRALAIHDLRSADTRGVTSEQMTQADNEGILFETVHQRKDGSTFPVEVSSQGATLGETRCLISVIRDITQRKRAQAALQESNARYDELVRRIPVGVFALRIRADGSTAFEYESPQVGPMLCLDPGALVRDAGLGFAVAHPEDRENLIRTTMEGARSMKPFRWEGRFVVRGETRWVRIESDPTPLHGGDSLWNGVICDITERRHLEEKRRELEDRLARAEKMESLGTMAGGVAHDLNNVLGVLVGYSELLLMEIPEESPLRKHVGNILRASQRSAAIIQDLLTLARRGVAVSEVVKLNQVISEYIRTPEFEKLKSYHPDVTFKIDLDQDLMNIRGSATRLGKTVMNLLSNAAEAIGGSGEVVLTTKNRYLDRPVAGYDDIREGDYVVLTVSDNGKGISAEDLGKIFEPFYTKKVMGRSGTGLGLAVVWGTLKDHHGYVDVRSEEGKGSLFTLYFPVCREEIPGDGKRVPTESYQGRGEEILVVDDVTEQRELASAMLNGLGYRVRSAAGGEEAVRILTTGRADLLVLDMIMDPGIDGLETYRRILEIHPGQKAIIVSGFSETDRVKKAQALGAGAYVQKPYMREKIGLAVRRELDR